MRFILRVLMTLLLAVVFSATALAQDSSEKINLDVKEFTPQERHAVSRR